MIKQLERQLKADLFIQTTRTVELTTTGNALEKLARKLGAASQEAVRIVADSLEGNIGHVRIGFAGASTYSSIGSIVRELRRRKPGLALEVESSTFSPEGFEHVREKALDLAIGGGGFLRPR